MVFLANEITTKVSKQTATIEQKLKGLFVNRFVPNNISTSHFSFKCKFIVKPTVKKSSATGLQEYQVWACNSGQIYLKMCVHIPLSRLNVGNGQSERECFILFLGGFHAGETIVNFQN